MKFKISFAKLEVHAQKSERLSYCDFGFPAAGPPTSPNFKIHKTLVLQQFLLGPCIYKHVLIYITQYEKI